MEKKPIELSRRKMLAGLGTVGIAAGAAGFGTISQLSDQTDDTTIAMQAGRIEATMDWTASYNGNQVKDNIGTLENVSTSEEAGVVFSLDDVKPGDFGSITFDLSVQSNPAWAASCVNYGNSQENDVVDQDAENANGDGNTSGEIENNLLIIPFYSQGPNTFFDSDGPDSDWSPGDDATATSAGFWNSREGKNDFEQLKPRTLQDVSSSLGSLNTITWGDGTQEIKGPTDADIGKGCVLLEGDLAGDNPSPENNDDEQGVSPLPAGETLSFGYDWYLPWETGNEVADDSVDMAMTFQFSQARHSHNPTFRNTYEPGNYTPN